MGAGYYFVSSYKMLSSLIVILLATTSCLGGDTCTISQGSTTITAFCESGCCSSKCCTESESEGISTVAIVLSVLIAVIAILIIVVIVVWCYRKKKPACCYRNRKEDEEKETVLVGTGKGLGHDDKRKDSSVEDCSSGYSSSQSVKSVNNNNNDNNTKKTVARPASPFNGSPILSRSIAPAMSTPRATAMPPRASVSFANRTFDKRGDKTEMLDMKKQKSSGFKTVTFQQRINSPFVKSSNTEDHVRPHYPPILAPLYQDENTPPDPFTSDNKPTDSATDKFTNGHGYSRRHRKSYPAENKVGFLLNENETTSKSTITKRLSSPPPPNVKTNSDTTGDSSKNARSKVDIFETANPPKKNPSSRRGDSSDYNIKESAYLPTIVQAADSKDSINSIDMDENKESKHSQNTPFSSPYLATPYTIKKPSRRVLGNTSILTQSANSSPSINKSPELSNMSNSDPSNWNSGYVSSFMQQKAGTETESPV